MKSLQEYDYLPPISYQRITFTFEEKRPKDAYFNNVAIFS